MNRVFKNGERGKKRMIKKNKLAKGTIKPESEVVPNFPKAIALMAWLKFPLPKEFPIFSLEACLNHSVRESQGPGLVSWNRFYFVYLVRNPSVQDRMFWPNTVVLVGFSGSLSTLEASLGRSWINPQLPLLQSGSTGESAECHLIPLTRCPAYQIKELEFPHYR